jgi:CubicO group peptidase (beta-lactamase class C family)
VLESAIAPKSISEYLEDKIWQPIGAKASADWSIEKETEIEKTFCCIQATASDFAKFGMLYLNQGKANDKQLVPLNWIEKSIAINESEGSKKKYNYGWWFFSETADDYLARGFRGQYIYVNQEKQTVIVRFGADWAKILTAKWADIFSQISEQL